MSTDCLVRVPYLCVYAIPAAATITMARTFTHARTYTRVHLATCLPNCPLYHLALPLAMHGAADKFYGREEELLQAVRNKYLQRSECKSRSRGLLSYIIHTKRARCSVNDTSSAVLTSVHRKQTEQKKKKNKRNYHGKTYKHV